MTIENEMYDMDDNQEYQSIPDIFEEKKELLFRCGLVIIGVSIIDAIVLLTVWLYFTFK
jgi:hypothetical protein